MRNVHSSSQMVVEIYPEGSAEFPMFSRTQYLSGAQGGLEPGSTVVEVKAHLPGGSLWYNLTGADVQTLRRFSIDHDTGRVTAASRLEPSAIKPYYDFLVSAHNRVDPRKYAETSVSSAATRRAATVILHLSEMSPRCPKFHFSEHFGTVRETSPPDTVVIPSLSVQDLNKFEKLSYQITEDNSNDNFYVDVRSSNVSLRVKKPLDRDSMPPALQGIYTLTVTATNSKCASSVRLRILLEDVNDNSPVFEKNDFIIELNENSPPGHVVAHLTATDRDELDLNKLRYFVIDGKSNDITSITANSLTFGGNIFREENYL
ncbi:hypothetical protein LAZ67_9002569 [Cordylochernes scorpioides]|uniref:Cadherin domain-containing protein n=1 Tax=Cordylochernes scorpioides TaxID=51811 RepID=A0ABY6KVK3_9ARAC|nr:hypothetical protein LAZ67_9002569 [Cordylochernes scorpioides]